MRLCKWNVFHTHKEISVCQYLFTTFDLSLETRQGKIGFSITSFFVTLMSNQNCVCLQMKQSNNNRLLWKNINPADENHYFPSFLSIKSIPWLHSKSAIILSVEQYFIIPICFALILPHFFPQRSIEQWYIFHLFGQQTSKVK